MSKGSQRRGTTKSERLKFEAGWDAAFGRKARTKPVQVRARRPRG
jgi:hypothetical protein